MTDKKSYNYGIDLLKIIATIMIITMHVLGQGGVIRATEVGSVNYYIVWIMEALCYVAVNLYALSTGYLNAKKENIKTSSFIKRWFQVFFYVIFFVGFFTILMPGAVSLKTWIKAFIPILSNQYWYFTQYFVLFMAMPFLNKMINTIDKRSLKRLVLVIILVLSILPMIRQYDIFLTGHGFSALWLIALYIIGGYFSLYKDEIKYSKKKLWLSIMISIFVAAGAKFVIDYLGHIEVNDMLRVYLIDYTSLPIVISSLAILLLCANMTITKGQKAIKFTGGLTFGIYLFHVNGLIWQYIMRDLFSFLGSVNPLLMILGIIGGVCAIFLLGGVFEFLRIKLFEITHLNQFCDWLGLKLKVAGDYITSKL